MNLFFDNWFLFRFWFGSGLNNRFGFWFRGGFNFWFGLCNNNWFWCWFFNNSFSDLFSC